MFMPPSVPIVGQSSQVLMWYPTALVACKCKGPGEAQLLVVCGFQRPTSCPTCLKMYTITGVDQQGNINIQIAIPASPLTQ